MDCTATQAQLLIRALDRFGTEGLAAELGISVKAVRRWKKGKVPPSRIKSIELLLQSDVFDLKNVREADFTFIDLFAGIGGIRKGFEVNGGHCVFTSEWDKYARETYKANFDVGHPFVGDINLVTETADQIDSEIPDHDVLLAGFPCQPFSIAGVSKKNSLGRVHGFKCKDQGNLFFKIRDIIKVKKPAAFLLENVKNLESHDGGNTFKVIMHTLEEQLGYKVYPMPIDAKGFVPQHRERIYLVGFKKDVGFSWQNFQRPDQHRRTMKDILHPQDGTEIPLKEEEYILGKKGNVNSKYVLSQKLWDYLKAYKEKHRKKGNGFGFGLVTKNDISRTLSARYYKDGSEILVSRGPHRPRRLTPKECARLMGFDDQYFPEGFRIPVSDTQAYKQFGNSVVVPVIDQIALLMRPYVLEQKALGQQSTDESQLVA